MDVELWQKLLIEIRRPVYILIMILATKKKVRFPC